MILLWWLRDSGGHKLQWQHDNLAFRIWRRGNLLRTQMSNELLWCLPCVDTSTAIKSLLQTLHSIYVLPYTSPVSTKMTPAWISMLHWSITALSLVDAVSGDDSNKLYCHKQSVPVQAAKEAKRSHDMPHCFAVLRLFNCIFILTFGLLDLTNSCTHACQHKKY